MVKRLLLLGLAAFALGAQAQYQIGNSDFETWNNKNEPGNGWYSFVSAGGDYSSYKTTSASTTSKLTGSDARNGGTSVRLQSKNLFIANANGNLTTGKVNMGDTSPTSSKNYNYTARGTNNCCAFTGRPDAFEYWAKFSRGGSGTYNGRCNVIIHGDIDYRDPGESAENEANYKIAEATVYATPCDTWTKFSEEFTYTDLAYTGQSYVLATFTTNPTPGGSSGDKFDIDDVKFIYYSQLKSLKINGESVSEFNKDTYDYSIDEYYVEGTTLVTWEDNTFAGVADVNGVYDPVTCKYTITVKGQDYSVNASNVHTYTIQFKVPEGPEVISTKPYSEDLYVTVAGTTLAKQVANVEVETLDNGNINFVLKNFLLGSDEDAWPIGNIAVNDISVEGDNTFTFDGGIKIVPGDDSAYDEDAWLGPAITADCDGSVPLNLRGKFIGEDHVVVYIYIDISEFMGYAVEVHLGYARATMAVNAEAQYGTFCAPYSVDVPTGVQVSKITGAAPSGLLTLSEVTGTIPANTPVVLFAESGLETVEFFGVAEAGTPEEGLLTGVYEDTKITSGYVLQNLDGMVAFYLVDSEITVPANRCYLTLDNNAPGVKALAFPDGTMTSISEIQAADEKAVIYDLSGRRVSKATKGIYIINGKKVIK